MKHDMLQFTSKAWGRANYLGNGASQTVSAATEILNSVQPERLEAVLTGEEKSR